MKKRLKFSPHFLSLHVVSFCCISGLTGCTPTIQLDTPKEGITINMNVVVDHNISVKMDEKTQEALKESEK